jgi:hypothetical protein
VAIDCRGDPVGAIIAVIASREDVTVIWERSGEAYYATLTEPSDEIGFHLIVESDRDRWDWAVWRPGEKPQTSRHGVADTVQNAMQDAERAVL